MIDGALSSSYLELLWSSRVSQVIPSVVIVVLPDEAGDPRCALSCRKLLPLQRFPYGHKFPKAVCIKASRNNEILKEIGNP